MVLGRSELKLISSDQSSVSRMAWSQSTMRPVPAPASRPPARHGHPLGMTCATNAGYSRPPLKDRPSAVPLLLGIRERRAHVIATPLRGPAWLRRPLEPQLRIEHYRLLRAILNTAVEDGILVTNPCAIRGAGAERTEERRLPIVEQVFDLADAVKPRYRALVLVAAFSGLRRGELFGLRRAHVDLEHGTVTVALQRQRLAHGELVVGPPKSDAGHRIVALPREALEPLAAHLARFTGPSPTDWVFAGDKGGPLREAVWQHEWAKARAQRGLPRLHFHDLRHAAATMAPAPAGTWPSPPASTS